MTRIVLDTNVLVAAMRSKQGASHRLVQMIAADAPFRIAVSVPLVLEYEMALKRRGNLSEEEAEAVVDYLCSVADRREIYFLWRPFLRDPSDEMVLEVAVGAEAECIVTHNIRDFAGVEEQFGVRAVRPGAFLVEMEAKKT
jgi:putative PIN family toxin of toxin-antitoxin system